MPWRKWSARDPNDHRLPAESGVDSLQERKYEAAQKTLDTLKAKPPDAKVKPPDEMEVLRTQIRLYAEQGKADEAIHLCDQIVAKLHNAAAYTLRGAGLRHPETIHPEAIRPETYDPKQYEKTLRDFDEKALADFGQIIALDPQKAESWAARADFYRVSGRVREGIADIRKALELAPDNLAIQKLAALLFIASGEPSFLGEADTLLDKALAAFEKSPPTNAEEPHGWWTMPSCGCSRPRSSCPRAPARASRGPAASCRRSPQVSRRWRRRGNGWPGWS